MNILFICCSERYKCKNKTYRDIVENYATNAKYSTRIIYTDDIYSKNKFCEYNPDIVVFFDIDKIRYGNKFNYVFEKPVYVCSLNHPKLDPTRTPSDNGIHQKRKS